MSAFMSPWQYGLLSDVTIGPAKYDNRQLLITFPFDADVARCVSSLRKILNKYPIFRSSFHQTQYGWRREISSALDNNVVSSLVVGKASETEINRIVEEKVDEWEMNVDVSTPHLARFFLLDDNLSGTRIIVFINHLLFDWTSLFMLFNEFERNLALGWNSPTLDNKPSFERWTAEIHEYMHTHFQEDASYWLEQPWHRVEPIALEPGAYGEYSRGYLSKFTENMFATRADIRAVSTIYGIHPVDLILCALARLTWERTNSAAMSIAVWENGRPAQYAMSMGMFAYYWPIFLDRGDDQSDRQFVDFVKRKRAEFPQRFSFKLARFADTTYPLREKFQAIEKPQFHFNYTGDILGGTTNRNIIDFPSRTNFVLPRNRDIGVFAFWVGDKLALRWAFSPVVYNSDAVWEMAQSFGQHFNTILAGLLGRNLL